MVASFLDQRAAPSWTLHFGYDVLPTKCETHFCFCIFLKTVWSRHLFYFILKGKQNNQENLKCDS